MANQKPLALLRQGVAVWNLWRENHPGIRPDLSGTDLIGADLSGADLTGVNLIGTLLIGANLREANLREANLREANLRGAHLRGAHLQKAHLCSTIFARNDLCAVHGLDQVIHHGPSHVDVNTVRLPEGDTRMRFLRGTGFSDLFIDSSPCLFITTTQFNACFISYAHQDEALARRLYTGLQDKGLSCWFASHDLRPGIYFHRGSEDAIHVHEQALLLLSEHAVGSPWIAHEVETALSREAREGRELLFPLRLDDTILHTQERWAMRLRNARHIGDFTQWQDSAIYQQRLADLLRHLKVKPHP